MAKTKLSAQPEWKTASIYRAGLTLTAGMSNGVPFSTEIANAKPSGYTFHHLEYIGVWPEETWNSAVVGLLGNSGVDGYTDLQLVPITTQRYTVRAVAWYKRE